MTAVDEEAVVPEFAHAVRGYDRYQVDDYIERLHEWTSSAQSRAAHAERAAHAQAEEIRSLRERIHGLEQERPSTPDQALKAASDRATAALTAALHQADEIRRRAAADAEHRLEEAGREALAIVEASRQSVAGLHEEATRQRREARQRVEAMLQDAATEVEVAGSGARTEAARIVSEAEAAAADIRARSEGERRQADEAVQRLQAEREEIMGELHRLRTAIQTLLSGAQNAARLEAGNRDDGPGEAPATGRGAAEPTAVIDAAAVQEASRDGSPPA